MGFLSIVALVVCALIPLVTSSCSVALNDCKASEICTRCANSKAICKVTADPLYCAHKMDEKFRCYWASDPCDNDTNLSYGCHNGRCYSQCIGPDLGDKDWCYLRQRKVGPVKEFNCTQDDDCDPNTLSLYQCGPCSRSFF